MKYTSLDIGKPDPRAVAETIIKNKEGYDDVLFLGGEPCLFLNELYECLKLLRQRTKLKLFVTTAVPKICYDKQYLFYEVIKKLDGINLSVQHYLESAAADIRCVKNTYDRQRFYKELPYKEKMRVNLNLVKPYLCTKATITKCIQHYYNMGFRNIKISEIQHGKEHFVSFEKLFGIKLGSPFFKGCQTYIDPNLFSTPDARVLLKRSCFACEETLKASFMDGVKTVYKIFQNNGDANYSVVYGNGFLSKGWL
jgi:organic radical activating enzyme